MSSIEADLTRTLGSFRPEGAVTYQTMTTVMSSAAPGRLEAVRAFVNSVDLESGADELASPGSPRALAPRSRPRRRERRRLAR